MDKKYIDYALDVLEKLIKCDSPSGFTENVAVLATDLYKEIGYDAYKTVKGGIACSLGGENKEDGLILSAHIDTLGAMVKTIKSNGRLTIVPIGGLSANNIETEVVRVYARDGKAFTGNIQLINASVHVNGAYNSTQRTYQTIEVVLDADVSSAEDVKKLGIYNGCFCCVDPAYDVTDTGFIKSRYLDDKLSVAAIMAFAKYLKDENITPKRALYSHFTVYEEIGHGAAGFSPEGCTEILGVDMGCVGEGLECTEKQVSICALDGSGPYNYPMTQKLITLSEQNGLDYAVDIYPYYSSDCSVAVREYDLRHALIGAGVYASHGYERSHVKGLENTIELIKAYALD